MYNCIYICIADTCYARRTTIISLFGLIVENCAKRMIYVTLLTLFTCFTCIVTMFNITSIDCTATENTIIVQWDVKPLTKQFNFSANPPVAKNGKVYYRVAIRLCYLGLTRRFIPIL